jgi:glycosyltransferase involved in cell wall biosynthesis
MQANSATGVVAERKEEKTASKENDSRPATVTKPTKSGEIQDSPVQTQPDSLILVAMPAFNEEKYIAKTIVLAQKYATEILVVDDGSTDTTADIAKALGAIVIRHSVNKGYGGALHTIFDSARELNADILVIIDADGQHNPDDIPKLIEGLNEGVDVVIGSRFLDTNGSGIPTYRKAGMKVLDIATMAAGGINVSDTQSGFRAYGKRAIEAIHVNNHGMAAGSEILLRIKENDLKIGEIPIVVRYDLEDTSSKGPVSHGLEVLNQMVKVISYRKPMWFFGLPGVALTIFGIIMGSWAFSEYYITSKFPYLLSMVCGLSLIIGLLLITSGLILNSLVAIIKTKNI